MRHLIETLTEREMVLFDAAVRMAVVQLQPDVFRSSENAVIAGLGAAEEIAVRIVGARHQPNPGTSGVNPLVNPLAGPPKGYPQ
jgi:hypothetical protein